MASRNFSLRRWTRRGQLGELSLPSDSEANFVFRVECCMNTISQAVDLLPAEWQCLRGSVWETRQ